MCLPHGRELLSPTGRNVILINDEWQWPPQNMPLSQVPLKTKSPNQTQTWNAPPFVIVPPCQEFPPQCQTGNWLLPFFLQWSDKSAILRGTRQDPSWQFPTWMWASRFFMNIYIKPVAIAASPCRALRLPQPQKTGRALKSQTAHLAILTEITFSSAFGRKLWHVKLTPMTLLTISKWTKFQETVLIYNEFLVEIMQQGKTTLHSSCAVRIVWSFHFTAQLLQLELLTAQLQTELFHVKNQKPKAQPKSPNFCWPALRNLCIYKLPGVALFLGSEEPCWNVPEN